MNELNQDNYFVWHPFTNMAQFYEDPLIFKEGHDSLIQDTANHTFINSISGLWNMSLGFGNQEIIDAISDQLSRLPYASLFRMGHEAAQNYAAELVKILPGDLNKVFFTSNGSESVETMIKAARQYHRMRGKKEKYNIICLNRAYHGVSYGALSASGFPEDQEMYMPLLPGFIHIDPPYCLRCPYHKTKNSCGMECAKKIEEVIEEYSEDKIAGFLMEPVLGFGGFIIPPDEFFVELKKILAKHDILFMLDEVTTGFGRTGKLFAAEHWDLKPDMMSMGKAMSAGYLPLGAAAFTDKVFSQFSGERYIDRFNHGSTFSGHPACCAAGQKVLEIYLRDNIIEKVRILEQEINAQFKEMEPLPCIGEIRIKGAMLALEFVTDKQSLNPVDSETMFKLAREMLQWGVLSHLSGNSMLIIPPLNMPVKYVSKIYNTICSSIKKVLKIDVKFH
jgi:adenosylmethionine-8-amino-7-oxononanoate aminotransferase